MTVRVRLTQPRLRKIAGVQLRPGLQSVSDEQWAKIAQHPVGAANLEKGVLVEVGSKKEAEGPRSEPTAAELAEQMADVYDVEALRKHAEDKRATVAKAAKDQLAKIEAAKG